MTIAPADPASAAASGHSSKTGSTPPPGGVESAGADGSKSGREQSEALLRTLTELTADLHGTDPRSRRDRGAPRRSTGCGRSRVARSRGGGGRGADRRGARVLAARGPAAHARDPRGGRRPGGHVLLRVHRDRAPRGPDRGPHRRIRTCARRPAGRPGGSGDGGRSRRPLRVLRAAHGALALSAAAPHEPPSDRDPAALPAAGRLRPGGRRVGRGRRRGRRAVPADQPARLPALLPHALQLRHPARPDVVLLPAGLARWTSWTRSTSATSRSPGSRSTPAASVCPTPASGPAVR